MNVGLQDAGNLGWKLAAVVHGWAHERLLDTYQRERHPIGKAVLRSSGLNLRLAMAHNPFEITLRKLRAFMLGHVPAISRQAVGEITGIGYSYPSAGRAGRGVGKRVEDVALDDGRRLYEVLRTMKFVLVVPTASRQSVQARVKVLDRVIVASWESDRSDSIVVRPDGYLAWVPDLADTVIDTEMIERWMTLS